MKEFKGDAGVGRNVAPMPAALASVLVAGFQQLSCSFVTA